MNNFSMSALIKGIIVVGFLVIYAAYASGTHGGPHLDPVFREGFPQPPSTGPFYRWYQCDTGLPGICAAGTKRCQTPCRECSPLPGTCTACMPVNEPTDEICADGLDNDCDGAADELCESIERTPFGEPADLLEIQERLGNVKSQITEAFMPRFLAGGILTNAQGTTAYRQVLHFERDATDEWVNFGPIASGKVLFEENEEDIVDDFLFFRDAEIMFEYELQFTDGLRSAIVGNTLPDLLGLEMRILGVDFTIAEAVIDTTTQTASLLFRAGTNSIVWADENYADDEFGTLPVVVNGEVIEDAVVKLRGSAPGSVYTMETIQYRLAADAFRGNVYIPRGFGLREYLDEPWGMVTPVWDIRYDGLVGTGASIVRFDVAGDDSYTLHFTNKQGLDYNVPLVDNSNDAVRAFTYGDENNVLYFRECATSGAANSTTATGSLPFSGFCIKEDDFFALTDQNGPNGITRILTYEYIDPTAQSIVFTDLGAGQIEVTYDTTRTSALGGMTGTSPQDAGGEAEIIIAGNVYKVYVSNSTGNHALAIDLNSNGIVQDSEEVFVVVDGGGMLDLGTQCTNGIAGNATGRPTQLIGRRTTPIITDGIIMDYTSDNEDCNQDMNHILATLISLNSEFDENGPNNLGRNENITINISVRPGNELDLTLLNRFQAVNGSQIDKRWPLGPIYGASDGSSYIVPIFQQWTLQQDPAIRQGMTPYGVFWEVYDGADPVNANELTIEYPIPIQLSADVAVEAIFSRLSQCSDSIDNDGDLLIDFPSDPGCADFSDDDEFG